MHQECRQFKKSKQTYHAIYTLRMTVNQTTQLLVVPLWRRFIPELACRCREEQIEVSCRERRESVPVQVVNRRGRLRGGPGGEREVRRGEEGCYSHYIMNEHLWRPNEDISVTLLNHKRSCQPQPAISP
ncbi:hypothetical protein KUCAC02_004770, partial [Chaenocephalus aceratus]